MNKLLGKKHGPKKLFRRIPLAALLIVAVVNELNPKSTYTTRRLLSNTRYLSRYLGEGKCQWQAPLINVPDDIDFTKTLVAGYPSGDKRLTYAQMEGLTGLPARDEWDYVFQGPGNHPFIKANYPHHEGIWVSGYCSYSSAVVLCASSSCACKIYSKKLVS